MNVQTAPDAANEIQTRPIFIFESAGIRYGIGAHRVREVFFLPEVSPLPEAPRDIIGAIDLRGRIVPVMDLQRRFGYAARDHSLTDSTIVFECDGLLVGLVVNAAISVYDVPLADFRDAPNYGRTDYEAPATPAPASAPAPAPASALTEDRSPAERSPAERSPRREAPQHHFINGIAQTSDGAVLLLDCAELVHRSGAIDFDALLGTEDGSRSTDEPETERPREFCPNATPEQRKIFRERAIALQSRDGDDTEVEAQPLAIVEISGEFFGIDLKFVREFCEVKKIVPVPCCPDRILGNTNLRGEILTLVSLHELLDLPPYRREAVTQAVVVQIGETSFGIAIDDVFDVMNLVADDLAPTPTALQTSDEFVRGTASYRNKMLGVLDLVAIVEREVLVVESR